MGTVATMNNRSAGGSGSTGTGGEGEGGPTSQPKKPKSMDSKSSDEDYFGDKIHTLMLLQVVMEGPNVVTRLTPIRWLLMKPR